MKDKQVQENILYEDEEVSVVLPANPITKGHVILMPRQKYKGMEELPGPLMDKLLQLTQAVVRMQKKTFGAKGYSLMQNGGAFNASGNFQLHIFPRRSKEEFAWTYKEEVDLAAKEFQKVRKILSMDFKALIS